MRCESRARAVAARTGKCDVGQKRGESGRSPFAFVDVVVVDQRKRCERSRASIGGRHRMIRAPDFERHGWRDKAYMDVFTACPARGSSDGAVREQQLATI